MKTKLTCYHGAKTCKVPLIQCVPKKGYPLKLSASAECSSLNACKTSELRIYMHALRIDLHILGLMRELKHSNSNMRHSRLTSKGGFFLHTLYLIDRMLLFYRIRVIEKY